MRDNSLAVGRLAVYPLSSFTVSLSRGGQSRIASRILARSVSFDKSNEMTNKPDYTAESETTIADAFRSPAGSDLARQNDGVRLRIDQEQALRVRHITAQGFAAVWGLLFPNATVVELSGKVNLRLRIYSTHVQIENRRWFSSSSVLARFRIEIPLFDEIGDQATHMIVVESALAFLYPFVPMHVQVSFDDEIVFRQGKFRHGS